MDSSAVPSQTPTLREEPTGVHEEHVASTVNIRRAENEFHRLERIATTQSRKEILRRRTESFSKEKKKQPDDYDEEKAEEQEPFDLKEYLSSSNDKATAAGLKHKHVGVTWEGLEVQGVGGGDHKVRLMSSILP